MWCPDRMGGGGRCGGGARCGGSVGYIWIHFCIGEYIFCIGGMFEKNYLKFSQIFSNLHFFLQIFAKKFRGARCGRSVGYIFSIGNFGGKKNYLKFSQIFSNFLGIHFYVLAMAENYLKFSQIFSNFLKSFSIFSGFSQKMSLFVPGGVQWWEGTYRGGYAGIHV